MKMLDKYIIEAGGFFGNTKTSKTDLVMDWIKTYMPFILDNPDLIRIDNNGTISILNNDNFGFYQIGDKDSPALDGMPPIKFTLKNKQEYKNNYLIYNCEIKKFGVPLNIDDYNVIYLNQISSMVENPDIFNQTCKVINDCKSVNYIYFDFYNNGKVNKNTTDYKSYDEGFKELKRDFDTIIFNDNLFRTINFNQDIKVNNINIHKSNRKIELLPKIISLPVCKYLCFSSKYGYRDILEMLSDYIPNPKIKNIYILHDGSNVNEKEIIKNIILGKKLRNEIIR